MHIVVMGSGGVGGYFGARLAQAGEKVSFIARGKHLEAMRAKGLSVKSALGDAQLKVRVFQDPREAGPADVVMFAVKLWDTEGAAEQIRPIVQDGVVIPFQNGVDSASILQRVLGAQHVLGGVAYIAATIRAPGVIAHTGAMAKLVVGAFDGGNAVAAAAFRDACVQAGIDADLAPDIRRALWEKFCFLAAVSGTTTLARQPLGVVRDDPDLRHAFEAAMREVWHLGRARGVGLADDFIERQMAFLDTLPAQMRSSMLNDLVAGNRLEAPWLSGAVARMAAESGTAAPVNATMFAAMKPYIDGARS